MNSNNDLFLNKKKHKNLFILHVDDTHAVTFRLLKWGEYKSYRDMFYSIPEYEGDIHDDIFKLCVIDCSYPYITNDSSELETDWTQMPAGVPHTIANLIYSLSGSDGPAIFQQLAEVRDGAILDVERRILSVVSSITKNKTEDFEEMYWPDILMLIAQSELIMSGQVPEVPFQPAKEKKKINFNQENQDLKEY